MAARRTPKSRREVFIPNLGVYLDRPPLAVDERALIDCLNIRLKEGKIKNENMGWAAFHDLNLDDNPCLLIDQFYTRDGTQTLIFGTDKDLYYFSTVSSTLKYITPRYEAGQVDVVDTSGTVTENGCDFETAGIKAGDQIWIGDASKVDQDTDWRTVVSVAVAGTTLVMDPVWDGATGTEDYTIRKLFTGDLSNYWVPETFPDAQEDDEDKWFATNGTGNEIVMWDGSDDEVEVVSVAMGVTCDWIKRYKNMMLYGSILWTATSEKKPQTILNSAISYPENVTTDEAAEFSAIDGTDALLSLEPLADVIVAYGERSINLVQYVGPPLNFMIRTVVPGVGPIAGRMVANFGDYHEFVGADTGYRFDGVELLEHGGQLFRETLRKTDPNRKYQSIAHIDEENGEVLWVIPLTTDSDPDTGGPETAYSEHYLEAVKNSEPVPMAIRDLPATAMGYYLSSTTMRFDDYVDNETFEDLNFPWDDRFFFAAFPVNLFGTVDGDIFTLGIADSQDGGSIESFARFGTLQMVEGIHKALIKRIEPAAAKRAGAHYDLTTTIYGCDNPDGDFAEIFEGSFDLAHAGGFGSGRYLFPRKTARYAQVKFGTEGANRPWEILGYAIESQLAGER